MSLILNRTILYQQSMDHYNLTWHPSTNFHTTPIGGRLSPDQFNCTSPSTWWMFKDSTTPAPSLRHLSTVDALCSRSSILHRVNKVLMPLWDSELHFLQICCTGDGLYYYNERNC
ncbi:hypothetical protein TNCV_3126861 [Trichonephila clavipes]|nr:hypothetical protein TNCV_3126861 [Trichonephila clavipes]